MVALSRESHCEDSLSSFSAYFFEKYLSQQCATFIFVWNCYIVPIHIIENEMGSSGSGFVAAFCL